MSTIKSSDSISAEKLATYQLCTIVLMWLAIDLILQAQSYKAFNVEQLIDMVDQPLLLTFLLAGILVICIFQIIGMFDKTSTKNAKFYTGLALDEIGGYVYHFGSLLIVCARHGAGCEYTVSAFLCAVIGYIFKVKLKD